MTAKDCACPACVLGWFVHWLAWSCASTPSIDRSLPPSQPDVQEQEHQEEEQEDKEEEEHEEHKGKPRGEKNQVCACALTPEAVEKGAHFSRHLDFFSPRLNFLFHMATSLMLLRGPVVSRRCMACRWIKVRDAITTLLNAPDQAPVCHLFGVSSFDLASDPRLVLGFAWPFGSSLLSSVAALFLVAAAVVSSKSALALISLSLVALLVVWFFVSCAAHLADRHTSPLFALRACLEQALSSPQPTAATTDTLLPACEKILKIERSLEDVD